LVVRTIAEQVNIDRETVRKILREDLDTRKVYAKMVPKEHTEEQKNKGFLASTQITVLEHPPYSADLAPSDFFLFPKIKEIF
jgi:energy-converting hydrogenase A subunit M